MCQHIAGKKPGKFLILFIIKSFLNVSSADNLEPGKFLYLELLGGDRLDEHLVNFDDFGDLGFWKSLEINDSL